MTYYPVCFFSFLATVNTSKFTVAVIPVAREFQVANGTAGYLVSFSVLALGVGNFLSMVILRKLGRRLTFLIFIPILAAANAWSSRAQSFGSLIAATILSSLACGAGEAPVATIAADLYSARERGSTMMVFNIALSAGLFVGPLINSTIAEFVGWRWVCGWIGIASILLWLITFGMVHETCSYPQGQLNDRNLLPETLSLKAGYNRDLSLVTAATNTICVIAYPSVLWAGVTIGVFVGW
jgi:predicted MFS family arabinose efflux permease